MEKRKKIICTVTNDLAYDRRMQRICESLSSNGMDVMLVGRKNYNSKVYQNQLFKTDLIKCIFNKKFLFYAEYNIRLFFYLMFHSYDVVCGVDMDTLPAAWLSARLKGKKCYYDAHEYFSEVIEVQDRKRVKWVWQKLEQFLLPRVDKAYTVSQTIADTFKDLYSVRVDVIRNLPYFYKISDIPLEYGIIYQGALNEGRGLESLILAMKTIDSNLLIVGDGYLKDTLTALIKEHKLEDKIHFAGFIEPEKLNEYTAKAALGISFLENKGRSYYFSLSNKFFDYIMAGKPQIGSNFSEYSQINEQYEIGVLLDNLTPDIISFEINKLLNNNDLYDKLKANCLISRKELSWEKEEEKLLKIYQND